VAPRLAIQEVLVPGDTVAERLEAAVAAGFDGLELLDADPERLPELRPLLASGALLPTSCPAVGGWLGDFDPAARGRALDRLRRQLDGVAELGGHGVVTPAAWGMFTRRLPPFDEPPRTPEEDREVLVEGLAELGAHAERAGVLVLFEPLNRYEDHMVNTVAQAAELAAASGSPAVRVLADTYHMNIEEDDPCAALRSAADVLAGVHLSDSNRHQPGTGHVPFQRILATLADAGFTGVLSVECRMRGEPAEALRRCGSYLRELLDEAWPREA
jgi:sugar phosphate isomerase/epimerase